MITIFLIENYPWVYYTTLGKLPSGLGEWCWVGRVYK